MAQKGLTKKQLLIQLAPFILYILLAVFWTIDGFIEKSKFMMIAGPLYLAFTVFGIIYLVLQYRRNPVVDDELDAKEMKKFKEGMKGVGIVYGILAAGFIIAFGLAAILK